MTIIRKYISQFSTDAKSLPTFLSAVFGFVLLLVLIFCLQQWYADWIVTHATETSAHSSTKDETAEMIAAIPAAHLFGQKITSGDAPVSNLELRVTGIVKAGPENSKVYISISGKPGQIFRIGDELPNGVKVYDITPDTVILDNEGHLEKLPLPREGLTFKPRNREPE